MMNSKARYTHAYVWIWLPGETEPVVAGKLTAENSTLVFNYGKSYLARENSMAIYDTELPLKPGIRPLLTGLSMPNSIRDAAPDAWGRRVLINRWFGARGAGAVNTTESDELGFFLESGSDRIGALDFQLSATEYVPRSPVNAALALLLDAAALIEKGAPLPPELDQAIHHGSSIGGARPKALIEHGEKKYIAKFSSSTDLYSVVKAEFIAMRLAALAGLDVAAVSIVQAAKKDVLLIERFDRVRTPQGWQRKAMVSGLTLQGLDEMMARYASYENLAEIIRHRFRNASASLRELFSRLAFNILCGNTDDHARNHAAFWDGEMLSLTPAYDICPQGRTGNEATQAMLISGDNRMSQLKSCLDAAHQFLLSRDEAVAIIEHQIAVIEANWDGVCQEANLNKTDRALLWRRQFMNSFAFEGYRD